MPDRITELKVAIFDFIKKQDELRAEFENLERAKQVYLKELAELEKV